MQHHFKIFHPWPKGVLVWVCRPGQALATSYWLCFPDWVLISKKVFRAKIGGMASKNIELQWKKGFCFIYILEEYPVFARTRHYIYKTESFDSCLRGCAIYYWKLCRVLKIVYIFPWRATAFGFHPGLNLLRPRRRAQLFRNHVPVAWLKISILKLIIRCKQQEHISHGST